MCSSDLGLGHRCPFRGSRCSFRWPAEQQGQRPAQRQSRGARQTGQAHHRTSPPHALSTPPPSSATGRQPACCIGSPEHQPRQKKSTSVATRQPLSATVLTVAAHPNATLAAGSSQSICSGPPPSPRHLPRACPTNGSDRGFARSILNRWASLFSRQH